MVGSLIEILMRVQFLIFSFGLFVISRVDLQVLDNCVFGLYWLVGLKILHLFELLRCKFPRLFSHFFKILLLQILLILVVVVASELFELHHDQLPHFLETVVHVSILTVGQLHDFPQVDIELIIVLKKVLGNISGYFDG